jgi:Uncharacterized protein conserved in bacteria
MQWTEERVGMLKKLWKQGKSAREIAEIMGGGLTRNAVIGKANRIGLRAAAARPKQAQDPENTGQGCQWPIGHPGAQDFHFCGAPREQGRPYCSPHCAVAYRRLSSGADND